MNQRPGKSDPGPQWVGASEATRRLGIKRETLYAYVSRGLVRSAPSAPGSRRRLYHADDLDRLRARHLARAGHGAVAAGALRWGEPVLETAVGEIRDDGPWYRGRPALALAEEGASFEDVCALLWGGTPAAEPPGPLRLGAPAAPLAALLASDAGPFDAMALVASALAAAAPRAEASPAAAREAAPTLVRRLVAATGLPAGVAAVTASLEAETTARALLVAMGGRTTASSVAATNEALVLAADHELNASSFAARVAASAGASLGWSVVAAMATLSGPRHGAATARVEALVEDVDRPERAAAAIRARLDRGDAIAGFGHPLYPGGDPRGRRLLELATRLGGRARTVRTLVALVDAMELAARERPTLDVGLVALAAALGLGRGAALALFACGRLAGWIAHALEQREAGFLLRPRARYVGS